MNTIFLTGGATGIGRACVEKFIAEGWNVAFMDTNVQSARELCNALPESRCLFIPGDVRKKSDCEAAVAQCVERFGGLQAVFSNAGIHQSNTLLSVSEEDLHRIVDINIYGTVNTLQAAVTHLISGGGGAVVINCSDQWFVGKPNNFAYGLTKGALGQITRSLSLDLAPFRIRVNAVCAGTIETPLFEKALEKCSQRTGIPLEQLIKEENELFPLGRTGKAEEVAEMVHFLASDSASFCTGGHYLVDGGLVAGR